jgi:drug/metabolite transporter (DMT)-like permease
MSPPPALGEEPRLEAARTVVFSANRRLPVEAIALISILLGAVGQLIVKGSLLALSARHTDPRFLLRFFEPALGVLAGLAVYAVGTLFWLKAVSRAPISYLYPLSASSYAVVALGGKLLYGENIQAGRWIGIAVITLGVAMLAGSQEGVRSGSVDSIGR